MKSLGAVLITFGSLALVLGEELFCYDCTPASGNCEDYTTAVSYNCYDELGGMTAGVSVTCYSAFINYSGITDSLNNPREAETGVYRACGIIPAYLGDYCDWFVAELDIYNINVQACSWCNTSRCNTHLFNVENGTIIERPETNNAPNSIVLSLILYILSVSLLSMA